MTYYNTLHEKGEGLFASKVSAHNQDKLIEELFRSNPSLSMTPFEVMDLTQMKGTPITSIRRSMNSLTRDGVLVKTDEKKLGEYGKLNYCWKLA